MPRAIDGLYAEYQLVDRNILHRKLMNIADPQLLFPLGCGGAARGHQEAGQIVIGARIVLLLLDAREANGLVSAVLSISQVFVAPFEGMLRTDSLHSAGSTLDVTAVVALVGWTILELIVLWVIGLFARRSTAATA